MQEKSTRMKPQEGHYDLDGVPPPKLKGTIGQSMETKVNSSSQIKDKKAITEKLNPLLADTYSTYLKTQNFHWNVTGPNFYLLHKLFETEYKELAESVDLIAERIRALGSEAPGTFKEFSALTTMEDEIKSTTAEQMISSILMSYDSLIQSCLKVYRFADEEGDISTCDMLAKLSGKCQKSIWMFRSQLPNQQSLKEKMI